MEEEKKPLGIKKIALYIVKIAVAAVILFWVYGKIDFEEFKFEAAKISLFTFLLAIFLFSISFVISAYRQILFFKDMGVFIDFWSNLKIYLLGMFYNLFLPGGVGGDAYKIYFLNKHYGLKTKESFWPFLVDRGSGLFSILVLIFVCALFVKIDVMPDEILKDTLSVGAIVLGFISVFFIVKWMRQIHLKSFFLSLPLSFLAQMIQASTVYMFVREIGVHDQFWEYSFLFFISSIATIIPITPGGAGLREMTYQYGSSHFGLDNHVGVFIGTLIFVIMVIISLFGVYYHFRKIKPRGK